MKHLAFSLLSLAVIAAGCSSQEFDEPAPVAEDSNMSVHRLALRTPQDALGIAIKAISEFSPEGNIALSRGMANISLYEGKNEVTEPTSRAIYVVNFSSGGYALVPADAESDEVVGVADAGNFIVNSEDPNDIGSYILTLASNFTPVPNDSLRKKDPIPFDTIDCEEHAEMHNGHLCHVRSNRVRSGHGALLTTKWHQHEPYSHLCPTYETTDQFGNDTTPHYAVGCIPLAMAQIMAYHRHPASHVDRAGIAYTYDWDLMLQKDSYGQYEFTPASLEVAKLTWSVAKDIIPPQLIIPDSISTGWGKDFSAGYSSNAPKLFKEFNYSVPYPYLQTYDFEVIKSQIDKHQPIYIDGQGYNPKGSVGHAWVIDGYVHNYTDAVYVDVETGETVDVVRTRNDEKVHCNMGYRTVAPGYFTSGIFKVDDADYSITVTMLINIKPNK